MAPNSPADFLASATTTALWLDQLGSISRRASLDGDTDVDVAIVGGGFSGLWTAYYLAQLDPTLRLLVIEKDFCGFGASGRNGGWAVGELASPVDAYAKRSSLDAARRQQRAVFDAVDEIGRVTAAEGIDCGYQKGGWIRLARTEPQARRQRAEIDHDREQGFTEDEIRLLEPDEARTYLNGTRVEGGIFFAPCASVSPARLVRGLAETVERAGVRIVEGTTVLGIDDGQVRTVHGTVRAEVVVQATEAYTRDLEGQRRDLLPIYSLMVATEPLPASVMDQIGLAQRPTFSDDRQMVIYGQRTDDNRLAFGGRAVPYLFGSRITRAAELDETAHEVIRQTLVDILPVLADTTFTHRWGGVLGVPRNWAPGVRLDRTAGRGFLGGYVGEGVAASNLAGRTLADLIAGQNTERTELPWVGGSTRRWEPEPFRWLGVRAGSGLSAAADAFEERSGRSSRVGTLLDRVLKGS